ncbi:PilZ domain protein [bacterium BMS3Abin06]|nr:PilZ domain protein [bacterium BMS3Abin06]HDZ01212.1 PilZ domain-containing protein [Nitrospirota bacterium]
MEKRDARRITAGYNARIIYSTTSYDGIIDNLSETGANIITFPVESSLDFRPGESIDLKFEAPSGEVLNLQCKIKWSSKIHPHKVKNSIGMKIIDPQWEKTACFL